MIDTRYTLLDSLLTDLERELRRANFWSADSPSTAALASAEPFAVDTLHFHQWLQFIFLPRMRELLATQGTLPTQSNIAAMAEMIWVNEANAVAMVNVLQQFDALMNTPSAR